MVEWSEGAKRSRSLGYRLIEPRKRAHPSNRLVASPYLNTQRHILYAQDNTDEVVTLYLFDDRWMWSWGQ